MTFGTALPLTASLGLLELAQAQNRYGHEHKEPHQQP
jgi:hypothetical protein